MEGHSMVRLGGSRKRKAVAHNLVEMCLTSSRRAFLSFTWAAKLLQSPKRSRVVGGEVPWSGFMWLQHSYLHQAVTSAFKMSKSVGRAACDKAEQQSLVTEGAGLQQGVSSPSKDLATISYLSLSDASEATVLHHEEDGSSDTSAANAEAGLQPSHGRHSPPNTAFKLAKRWTSSLRNSWHSSREAGNTGTPDALLVARAGTPLLSALLARHPQPQPSVCIASTPAGPKTNPHEMTMADLERLLRGNGWLNDEVINFYMLLINVNHFLKRGMALNSSVAGCSSVPGLTLAAAAAVAVASKKETSSATGTTAGARPRSTSELPIRPRFRAHRRSPITGLQQLSPSCCAKGLEVNPHDSTIVREDVKLGAIAEPVAVLGAEEASLFPGSKPPLKQLVSAIAAVVSSCRGAATAGAAMAVEGLGEVDAAGAMSFTPRRKVMRQRAAVAVAAAARIMESSSTPIALVAQAQTCTPVLGPCTVAALTQQHQPLTVFAFNSFFFSKLTAKGTRGSFEYAEVRRWTLPHRSYTSDYVLTRDLLLFPINHNNSHWCLAAIWPRRRLLQYFDSLGGAKSTSDWVLDTLQRWIMTDAVDKGVTLGSVAGFGATAASVHPNNVSAEWRREAVELCIPTQHDSCSCGVFACVYAELLGREVPPHDFGFSQVDIPALRRGIAEQILRGHI